MRLRHCPPRDSRASHRGLERACGASSIAAIDREVALQNERVCSNAQSRDLCRIAVECAAGAAQGHSRCAAFREDVSPQTSGEGLCSP